MIMLSMMRLRRLPTPSRSLLMGLGFAACESAGCSSDAVPCSRSSSDSSDSRRRLVCHPSIACS